MHRSSADEEYYQLRYVPVSDQLTIMCGLMVSDKLIACVYVVKRNLRGVLTDHYGHYCHIELWGAVCGYSCYLLMCELLEILICFVFSSFTEIWWEQMSKISRIPFTDQGLVNIALKALRVHWDLSIVIRVNMDMHGVCNQSQVQAVILSEDKICRYRCDSRKRDQYFVWHKPAIKRNRTVEKKKARAQEGAAWFLTDNWTNELRSSLTGFDWIQKISSQLYS